jgi:hypothetical protein
MINSYDSVSFATVANCVAVMPEIYMKEYMEKLDKIAEIPTSLPMQTATCTGV